MDAFEHPSSMAQALRQRAGTQPDRLALRFLAEDGAGDLVLSYAELDRRARCIAAALQARAGQGERAVLLFPSGPDYVAAFFGCLYAGIVAVPAYPPESARRHHQERLLSIIDDCAPRLVLTQAELRGALLEGCPALSGAAAPQLLCVDELDLAGAEAWVETEVRPEHIAFLQYTSGSTALPKGVQVSHGNLVANERLIRGGFGIGADDVIVSWLPLYHDMGLIGGLLQPVYSGVPCVLMSPRYFLERPLRWLEAISQHGGTVSGGPDFAYRLCTERVSESALAGLDLSRWRVAFSGSEPIRQDSLDNFAAKFAASRFEASSFFACYGLAEATLFVSGGQRGQGIAALGVDEAALAQNRIEAGSDSVLMCCGRSQPEHAVMIVDATDGAVLGENQVGEVWAAGPSIAHGYWHNPEATAKAFVERDGRTWLRTGDLGCLRDGELYVTGRLKDMLIIRGHNLYPQDIERAVETEVDAVRKGRVAAFAVQVDGEEGIGIAAEVGRALQKRIPADALIDAIRQAVAEACQEAPKVVALLNPGALPRTSSGKLQRSACRTRLADGSLDAYAVYPGQASRAEAAPEQGADALQARIAELWREHLGVERVGADDNFFLLGGNSIAAAQVMAALREALGVNLNLRLLFEAPSLATFSAAVADRLANGAAAEAPMAQLPRGGDLPQSAAQRRLWLNWQIEPRGCAYNIPGGLLLRGELDEDAVYGSFARLVQRHESLRTRFLERDGQALQRIEPRGEFHWQVLQLDASEAEQRREAEAREPFDLEKGPLLRVSLVRLDDDLHQLWVTLHHIVADGWSLNLLLDEFARLYAEAQGGQAAELAPLPVGYAEFASWQRQWLEAGEGARQLAYWREQLGEEAPVLELPTDHPRGNAASPAARLSLRLDDKLGQALREAAQANQASVFMWLLAAFQALLHRHSGQADIRVGVPSANRQRQEVQGLVGFFINTLVLRATPAPRQAFGQLLAQVREATLGAQEHQDLPFDSLLEALPGHGGQPFQVLFNHQQRDLSALRRLPGLLAEELPWHSREAKFDLQLQTEEDARGRLRLNFDYAAELFDVASIQRLADQYVALLRQVVAQPQLCLGDIALATDAELARLEQWGSAPCEPARAWLPEQLERAQAEYAERVALQWDGGELSHAELHAQANRLAHYLRDKGVGPDVPVAICAERSPQLLVGLLAILKAGGAYVPLDADYPAERLAYMLDDCGASLLLTQSHLLERLPSLEGVATLCFDGLKLDGWPSSAPGLHLHGANLAYVIYTSGSTGQPKGVGNTHAALAERLQWMQATYALQADDVLMQKAPVSFDVSVWECFWPLLAGCRLVLAGPGEHRDPARIAQLVRQFGVTTLHFVPPLLQLFIDEPGVEECTSLRRLFSGGEALPAQLRDRVLQRLPGMALHNRYGPTETAINVTHWHCSLEDGARSPIGRPLGNVICRVLDSELNPLPPGAAGELCIGGIGLARGYQGRPGLSAERFVADPLGAPGARLYRTGDRARWSEQGVLEYLGRQDGQVKLRGFRIELDEIRARLLAQPGVAQAVVLIRQAGNLGSQLLGYYTATADAPAEAEHGQALRTALQAALPEYMVPAQLMRLASMPLGPSGKLNLKALPEPSGQQREHVAPRDEVEQRLAAIWSEVLGLPQVGLDDDFFELGGHSLLATRIVSRARQAFAIELPLRELFDASRLGAFAERVRQLRAAGSRDSQGAIRPVDRSQRVPLSYSQQRMWFLWQLEPDSPAYNVGGMARLRGTLDLDCFERALRALVQRHETLRTRFPSVDGVPHQQVQADSELRMQRLDFSHLDTEARQQALQQLADDEAHKPFDLEQGPLLRVYMVRLAEDEHYLVVTLHHIVTEGWAMDIFARELSALYEAFLAGRESPLAPLPVQYLDYSVWQRDWLEAGERQRQLDYWTAQLGDEHPVLELPGDRPRPPVQSHRGDLYRFDLAPQLAERVRRFNAGNGLTQFMTMTAALAVLLYRYSGQQDLRIGAPVANRIRPESEGLIGAFLNTQVLRCRLDGQMSVAGLLEQVRQTVIDGQSHQDLPFDHLVEALQPPRSAAYNPLFQVMCNVQRWEFQQTRQLAGMTVEYCVNDARATKFDLNLEVTDLDQRLGCCLTYSRDLFDEPRIARMARHWQNLLAAMIADPQQRLGELPMLDAGEQDALLTCSGPQLSDTLHGLFAAQAAATPQAPALTFAGQSLSYAELDARANRLARLLRERGVGPEVRVGLALERSLEMVVGLLAILKAGGAYVPLDPEYPLERLHYMIEDSGVRLLLGQPALFEALGALPEGVGRCCPAQEGAALAALDDGPLPAFAQPQHLAYLIYTSGSTGKPKGVAVCHGEIAMHCRAVIERFGMRADDCELHFYSINFDAASERLLTPLLCGAHVVLRAQGQWGAEDICQLIAEHRVSILGFTPSYGSQLAQWLQTQGRQLPVRLCITGGEALTAEHLQRIRQAFAPRYFFNAYGPTETVVMPLAALAPEQVEAGAGVPIGSLVGERSACLLDADLALVPQGAGGELYVGGAGLARGYHERPALTAERFVPDPFGAPGGRLYRTGDRVRQRADGQVEYLGRIDQQVKIRGFRIELGEIEARLQEHPQVREAAVLAIDGPSGKQLVGYMGCAEAGADEAAQADLREALKAHLKQQLPDYMVPAHLVLLEGLPLTANGKLDRRALPAPDASLGQRAYEAPRSELERQLAAVWGEVLNVAQVGLDDNFFELGGDSILSIQVVSRARQQGIQFSPRDLFQHQSVRSLAGVARSAGASLAEQGEVQGESALTPIQQWFFELSLENPAHWNQSLLLEPRQALDAELLRQALLQLVKHHDALRLTFRQEDGRWHAEHRAADDGAWLLWQAQVASFDDCAEVFERAQRSLALDGPLLRAVLVDGPGAQRLLLAIHHLVVDGVSWRVLLEDLQQAYRQLAAGEAPQLPAKTSAFRDWTARLQAYAGSEPLREELHWWRGQLDGAPGAWFCDNPQGRNDEALARSLSLRLDREHTRQLLQQAPAAYRTQVNDLLLTALARVLCRVSGEASVLVQLEGHGREALFDDIDLSRTVGWFTSAFPLRLAPAGEAGEAGLAASIKAIKEQLRAVPHKGLGHGVLRHLGDESGRRALAELPQPRITFNYLGQFDQSFTEDALFHPLDEPTGAIHDAAAPLPNELSVDGQVYGGELVLRWTYSAERYEEQTIAELANAYRDELQALIAHCLGDDAGGLTPSDFPLARLSQAQLDALAVPAAQIDDVYPLTPMQEGLLLHTLLEPGTGIYYMQDRYRIDSELDRERFAAAWQAVVARHEALRASFSWNAGEAMLQVIHKPGRLRIEFLDWSELPADGHEERLQALHKQERETGFDLLEEPPFHLRLIRLGAARYWFMMSNHHILIDAWCRGLLMSDFFEIYSALGEGRAPQLPAAPRYRDYIAWLQRQDLEHSRRWWQQNLGGFERATYIPSDRPILHERAGESGGMIVGDRYTRLDAADGARLRELAQRYQLTVNTFAQAAWALVLRRYSGERDLLFGVTVAGRPVGLPQMQRTVGLFINSIPLRVQLPAPGARQTVRDWLTGLFERNLELREHEHLPLVSIQEASELPKGQPLFDSLFVFENAPVEVAVLDRAQSLKASSDSGRTHTNFPLTVVCYPGDDLGLHLSYDQRYFEAPTIERLLGEFKRLLLALADGFHGDVAELPLLGAEERRFLLEDCNRSEHAYPLEQGYVRLFEARVAAHPQRIAASCLDQQWSYAELNRRANRLGHALLAAGVGFDQPVALLGERGLDLLGMIVGSFKAGAGYLPLDPAHPTQRLTRILELSRTPVLVCSAACHEQALALLAELGCGGRPRLLVWDEVQHGAAAEHDPQRYSGPRNLAYVIYTSGSTGLPKGVMVEQAGMLNNQLSKVPYLALGEGDVIAQTASQSFDISVWQFLAAPLFGGRVAIVPNAIAQDPQALLEHVVEQGVSVLESVPSLIQGMLAEEHKALPGLRWMLPTGEAMPPELARHWLQRYPQVGLVNAYGPAECSDDVAFFRVDSASTEATYLPIGSPTDNNQLYLLDAEGDFELVPLGAVGELCVAGTGVGRGYVGDPLRTAQAFVPHPFGAPGERLYRTGDLARRRADGVLEYVGRVDHQVKIRGFRIELGEIEARLHELPEVREAAVAVQESATGKYLVGYLVPAATVVEEGAWLEQVRQHLRADLPDYMVPLHWQVLARMPLNANGKLDRKALPALDIGQALAHAYQAPRTELEGTLAQIWAEVLKVERVGVLDNFFELGGHSLLATQIASRVQKALQRNVPLRAMFECSTVEELASYIEAQAASAIDERKAARLDDLMSQLEML
ncbi:non-ribosomal peptide synthase/polyketide synthase [Pseudomonas citronellolis]|uniref:non-ribosomal peptide synthase/polyketide synthase n=1 Tax=Pseudomonas citronellolis TaxID=53408 RepID=UPI0021C1C7D9|nr:non-ribosomal peptide synthase/polyketide synthase [Pseudomonas citronellolis]UXJ55658.1 non-ribosomal peptide synthase/polyketide synthase [Pseudomonas citronellolis]